MEGKADRRAPPVSFPFHLSMPAPPLCFSVAASRQRAERVSRRPPTLLTPASTLYPPAPGKTIAAESLMPPRAPAPRPSHRRYPFPTSEPNPSTLVYKTPRPRRLNPRAPGVSPTAIAAKKRKRGGWGRAEEGRRRRRRCHRCRSFSMPAPEPRRRRPGSAWHGFDRSLPHLATTPSPSTPCPVGEPHS